MKKNEKIALVWDWNGTIVDDAWVFVEVLNILLKKNNLKQISIGEYKSSFCFPIINFYKKIGLYKNQKQFKLLNFDFLSLYKERMYKPSLVPNIRALLNNFQKRGFRQFLLSAQNQKTLNMLVDYYELNAVFSCVLGVNNNIASGKVNKGWFLKNKHLKGVGRVFLIGDTNLDVEVAEALGFSPCLVGWGHFSSFRLRSFGGSVCSSVSDLESFIIKSTN